MKNTIAAMITISTLAGCGEPTANDLVAYIYVDDDGSKCVVSIGPFEDASKGPAPDSGSPAVDAGQPAADAGRHGPIAFTAYVASAGWTPEGSAQFAMQAYGSYAGQESSPSLLWSVGPEVDCVVTSARTSVDCTGGSFTRMECPPLASLVCNNDAVCNFDINGYLSPTRASFSAGVIHCFYEAGGAVVTISDK